MADIVKQILAKPIQLADHVAKAADDVSLFKQECAEIKAKSEKLAGLLRQAARASNDLYERPTRRIIDDTEQILDKALALIIKCSANGFRRVFTIIPTAAFRKTSQQLENSIGDVSWLLQVSTPANDREDDEYLGLPPIATNEPILCLIWEQIAILCSGSIEERTDAANSLVSLARDNARYGKLIIEEGGVVPLLKLAKEGRIEGQENAARAIGLLGRDPESVEHIVNAGVAAVFVKILKEGKMKVQIVVAWAVSELAAHHPKCQDHFAQNNVIRLLVGHLAFETVQEHSKYAIASKQGMSIHTLLMGNKNTNNIHNEEEYEQLLTSQISHPMGNDNPSQMQSLITALKTQSKSTPPQSTHPPSQTNHAKTNLNNPRPKNHHHHHPTHHNHSQQHGSSSGTSDKVRESEDPETKAQMKAMAARALWHLCEGNVTICQSVTESRALLCFAILLEKGPDEVQYNSAMALMEITAVAEQHAELRRNAFKPTAPAAKAVVDQLLRIIIGTDSDFIIPCIRIIGHLARTFRATETRMIAPLVQLLDERDAEVTLEALVALTKFACTDNFLHINHSKAIIEAGGSKHLIQIVYFGEQIVQVPALVLLCYVAMHIPDNEVLAQEEVLMVLEWATKQGPLIQDPSIETLLFEAKVRLELYQSRGSRGLY
ncbi:uncharacterized protein LOC132298837 [Cornus florida]|uniref:uncharacterized protein LOC132298837 n=1 Tax=Cornus florida TaxID=4283 RepID=UPI00289B6DF3|nr:uncharacterized protein LOC132298837 [Cornus florida]